MQVQPMYFNNGLLQPAEHPLSVGADDAKKSRLVFWLGGQRIKSKPKPDQNMLKIIWLWQKHPVFVYLRSHLPILLLAGEFWSLPEG